MLGFLLLLLLLLLLLVLLLSKFRMENILVDIGGKGGLASGHVVAQPHSLPLRWSKLTGLLLGSVNGRENEQSLVLGSEDTDLVDAVEVGLWGILAEEVYLQLRVAGAHGIVLLT